MVPWGPLCEEQEVSAVAGCQGVEKREEIVAGARGVEWHIAAKRGKVRSMAEGMIKELTRRLERMKAQVWARVEPPFHVLKNIFRHRKTRYRGLAKNTVQLHRPFALANLFPEPDSDWFDRSPTGKVPEVPLSDGRILVLKYT